MSSSDDVAVDAPLYLDRFKVEKVLGEGSYGKVKLCYDTHTRRMVAVKIIPKESLKKTAHVTRLKREVRIMRLLHHPNITRLYDVIETDQQIVLTMEHVEGGELFDYIVAQKRLKDRVARRLFRQMISALEYCHRSSIIHRDLKPENLLLDCDKNIKIIDFGFVKLFDTRETLQTFCGSPFYASPEMILGKQYQGPEVDIWSMGVILFALLNGTLPFTDPNTSELYRKISSGTYQTRTPYMSPDSADLIKRMLTVDAASRATIAEIRQHRWVMQDYEEPPMSYVPDRPDFLSKPPDPAVMAKFPMYGMDLQAAEASLARTEKGPAWGLYHLLVEHEQWEAARYGTGSDGADGENSASNSPLPTPPLTSSTQGSAPSSQASTMPRKKNIHRLSLGRQHNAQGLNAPKGPSTPNPVPTQNPFDLPSPEISVRRRRSMIESEHTVRSFSRKRTEPQERVGEECATVGEDHAAHSHLQPHSQPNSLARPSEFDASTLNTADHSAPATLYAARRRTSNMEPHRKGSVSRPENPRAQSASVRPETATLPRPQSPAPADEGESAAASTVADRRGSLPRIGLNLSSLPKRLFRRMSNSGSGGSTPVTASADTTSMKSLAEIVDEIGRAMKTCQIRHTILSATKIKGATAESTIEIEICRIKGTEMHALQMKRIKGSSLAYQTLCQLLISQWKL